jgi:GT2 family glycosyltransferase
MASDPISGRFTESLAGYRVPAKIRKVLPSGLVRSMQQLRNRLVKALVTRTMPGNGTFEQPQAERLASASLSIIVPIHDAPFVTKRCLASLQRYAQGSEIILIDDGSKLAQTTSTIREFAQRNAWKIRHNETSTGHSAACAAGVQLASRPYLCLLNSDTVVTHRSWRAVTEAFEGDCSIGVVGPSTSSSGNEQTLDVAKRCVFSWNDDEICAFAEKLTLSPLQPVDLSWVSGFAFFIRSSLWNKLGGFDRNLRDHANEIELCKRVKDSGCRTVWVRSSYIHHFGNQSYGELMSAGEIKSREMAAFQYIRDMHHWLPWSWTDLSRSDVSQTTERTENEAANSGS